MRDARRERHEPPGGVDWAPPTSGNAITWDGSHVVKAFPGGSEPYRRERAALRYLSMVSDLPVPSLAWARADGRLAIEYIAGMPGPKAMETNLAGDLLRAMGEFLAVLHSIDTSGLRLPGSGMALVHGDFAPHNVIFRPDTQQIAAVLDWETAELGDPVLDLAWCEWQVSSRWPQHRWALPRLFEGYGRAPSPEARASCVEERLRSLGAVGGRGPGATPPPFSMWWPSDRHELNGFIAALSRVLASPTYRAPSVREAAEVWVERRSEHRSVAYLSEGAVHATRLAFGGTPTGPNVAPPEVPRAARLVLDGLCPRAMGLEEVERRLEGTAS